MKKLSSNLYGLYYPTAFTAFFVLIIIQLFLAKMLFPADDVKKADRHHLEDSELITDHKCGFPAMLQMVRDEGAEFKKQMRVLLAPRDELNEIFISPSGRFRIHYTTSGYYSIPDYDRNLNGTPDYLEFVSKSFDRAWQIEIDSLGFNPPPDSSGNPRRVYPVYCWLVTSSGVAVYGSTALDYEIPQLSGENYVTSIDIRTDFSFVHYPHAKDDIERDSMAIAVTAAHEFNHALQCGYRLWPGDYENRWFIESSAVFMEEVVAAEVNDYIQYLSSYFNNINKPLDNRMHVYGKVVFNLLLGQRYGKNITRKIWEEIRNQRTEPALEKVLEGLGTDILGELCSLSSWLYFIKERAVPGKFFPDAAIFEDDIIFQPANPVQYTASELLADSLPRLSFQWYCSSAEISTPHSFLLEAAEGTPAVDLTAILVNKNSGEYFQVPASVGFTFPNEYNPDSLFFSVVNGHNYGEKYFSFRMLSKPQSEIPSSKIYVSPQPFKLSDSEPFITFRNIPPESEIHIFSSNGKHLKTLRTYSVAGGSISWNLTTEFGHKLGSGVYIYRVESDTIEKTVKFVVVR